MREIKFRGKVSSEILLGNAKPDGTWVYGFYRDRVGCPTISEFDFGYGNYIDYEIDRNTLGQYTGLKDKNGKEIYEGDIVLVSKIAPAKVFYNEEDACYAFDYGKNGRPLAIDLTTDNSLEIIGNIFDNPELLKEKQDENN